jgi:DNA-binding NtrC family response regulator
VHVLEAVGGNRSRAAEALGIDRRTLYRMAERLGVALKDESERAT